MYVHEVLELAEIGLKLDAADMDQYQISEKYSHILGVQVLFHIFVCFLGINSCNLI